MATYDEIVANHRWFRQQAVEIGDRANNCRAVASRASCLRVADDAWPDELAKYRAEYGRAVELISASSPVGYPTGVARLDHLATGLITTLRAYLTVEAEAEAEIRSTILALLKEI